MTHSLIGLVDMDGTLCNYDDALYRDLQKIKSPGEELKYPIDYDTPHMSARIDLIRNQPGWWRNLEPLQKGFDVFNLMKELDYEIHILTKGPRACPNAWTEKMQWCEEHIPGIPVTITRQKGLVYGKVLVDDWPSYIESWLKWRPRGLVIMPSHPWNVNFTHPLVIPYDGKDITQVRKALIKVVERNDSE